MAESAAQVRIVAAWEYLVDQWRLLLELGELVPPHPEAPPLERIAQALYVSAYQLQEAHGLAGTSVPKDEHPWLPSADMNEAPQRLRAPARRTKITAAYLGKLHRVLADAPAEQDRIAPVVAVPRPKITSTDGERNRTPEGRPRQPDGHRAQLVALSILIPRDLGEAERAIGEAAEHLATENGLAWPGAPRDRSETRYTPGLSPTERRELAAQRSPL